MEIRKAVRGDGPAYVGLVRALAEFEKLAPPDPAACERLVEDALGADPKYELWVVDDGGVVVGYAATVHTYSTFRARPTLWLEDLFIHPDARRRGVARRVLDHLKAVAQERGCGRFEWSVLDWNAPAKALYDGYGATHLHDWQIYRVDL